MGQVTSEEKYLAFFYCMDVIADIIHAPPFYTIQQLDLGVKMPWVVPGNLIILDNKGSL
jgi:hypothetical protein